MNIIPIQVTDEGVLIPKSYFQNANEVEVVVRGEYFLLKPKQGSPAPMPKPTPRVETPVSAPPAAVVVNEPQATPSTASKAKRNPLIGGVRHRNPQTAAEAEKIIENENDRRHFKLIDSK